MGNQLRPGLHFCRAGGRTVLLDLYADRYFGLPMDAEDAFQAYTQGELLARDSRVQYLLDLGVLVDSPQNICPEPCHLIHPPSSSLVEALESRWSISWLVRATVALVHAEILLRRAPLHYIVAGLAGIQPSTHREADAERQVRGVMAAFLQLNQWLSARDRCLPRSMAVARLLKRSGVKVVLVFGVAARPFRAHCWVQYEGTVLNDRLENIRNYTPIFVVG